jgi:hypothetical protein
MPYRPPNGTSGEYFLRQTCCVCASDHGWHNGKEPAGSKSCPILMKSLLEQGPVDEWDLTETGVATCTKYAPCECAAKELVQS